MKQKVKIINYFFVLMFLLFAFTAEGYSHSVVSIENDNFKVEVDATTGVISSLYVKKNSCELVAEKRLASNFRINLQLKDNLANYIDGAEQKAKSVNKSDNVITVSYSEMKSALGIYPIDLISVSYTHLTLPTKRIV